MSKVSEVLQAIGAEVERAQSLFSDMVNPHEALGIIQEEFDEFKAEVYRFNPNKGRDTRPEMVAELKQLAAMCVRAIVEVGQ